MSHALAVGRILLIALLVAGVGRPLAAVQTVTTMEGTWRLVGLGEDKGTLPRAGREPQLVVAPGGAVTGWDGCNSFRGSVTFKDDTLRFGPLAGTLMACDLPDHFDRRFLEALGAARTWQASTEGLVLFDQAGARVARLEPVSK